MSNRDPEQLQADIGRWVREIRTWRATGLTDEHPNIRKRLDRIALAQYLLDREGRVTKPITCDCEEFDRDLATDRCHCGHAYDQHSEADNLVCTATETYPRAEVDA